MRFSDAPRFTLNIDTDRVFPSALRIDFDSPGRCRGLQYWVIMSMDKSSLTKAAITAPPRRLRPWLGWSLIGLVALGGAVAVLGPPLLASPQPTADDAVAVCATTPAEAVVTPADTPRHRYHALVPADNPGIVLSATAYPIYKGDVIEFDIQSSRAGKVAVHGFHDLQSVLVGGTTKIAFRAIYSGRFPLHFHGIDGSHFELAALEVMAASPRIP